MMPIISYMGTKAALSGQIAASFERLPAGPLLDLFAGMATVGRAVAPTRNVWLNDVQQFSRLTSEVQFLNCDEPQIRPTVYRAARRVCLQHAYDLRAEFSDALVRERAALAAHDWHGLSLAGYVEGSSAEKAGRGGVANEYRLFTSIYQGTYFGLGQCIEIDSIRKAIDVAAPENDPIFAGARRWMLAALGSAASRCSNSTGHFAQYLTVSPRNVRRVASQRRRSLFQEWINSLRAVSQLGDHAWRSGNRAFSADACELLATLKEEGKSPAVIYADPPYTSDQYSRYYHLLETLVNYDYPDVSGKGLYRKDRFVSDWSLKTKVRKSFESLIDRAAALRSSLVISYPTNGLLSNSEQVIPDLLRQRFRSVVRLTPFAHQHSTMGASKGAHRTDVMEQIFVAS